MEKFKFLNKDRISRLPKTAGVYCFRNGKEILYVGKAVNIQERAKQHKKLLGLAKQLGFIETNSEIGALILEAKLIKKYQPKYNIVWKDDKNYFFVAITKEDFPRVFITHRASEEGEVKNDGGSTSLIGPFVEGTAIKRTLTYLRRVFPYYTSRKHPKKNCLWCQLKLCPGPNPVKLEYQKNITNLISVLKSESKNVLEKLKKEMKKISNCQNYEKAAKIRDQIEALEKVMSHSRVFDLIEAEPHSNINWPYRKVEAYDVSNIQGQEATGAMVTFINGKSDKNFYRRFKIKIQKKPNDVAMLREIIKRRLKHTEWPYPDLILIDGGIAQLNVALKVKRQKVKGKSIKIMAIAKKKNELYIENRKKPILLKKLPRGIFNLILQLRDEAHRFAIAYHHKLRVKTLLK